MIPGFRTVTVGTAATDDYDSLLAALDYVAEQAMVGNIGYTIQVGDGTWDMGTPLYLASSAARHTAIVGANTYAGTIAPGTAISSSGSANNWSLTLRLSDVSNIDAGDYLRITDTSGGTNPTYLLGTHYVSAVNSGGTTVTLTSQHGGTVAPAGTISGTVTAIKTVLSWAASDGIVVTDNGAMPLLDNMVLVGPGTSVAATGIITAAGGAVHLGTRAALVGWEYGVEATSGGLVTGTASHISGSTIGLYAASGGVVDWPGGVVSGCQTYGLQVGPGGSAGTANATLTGNSANYSVAAIANGDNHDHNGGDGGQIAYSSLSGTPATNSGTIVPCGTALTTTASAQDVPSCSLSLAAGTYLIVGVFDVEAITTDRTFVGVLDVGGSDQSAQALYAHNEAFAHRVTVSQVWVVTLGSTTTCKLQAYHVGGSTGSYTVYNIHTNLAAVRLY